MLHRIKVRSRNITIVSGPEIVVDGIMSDTIEVDLDAEWSSYDSVKVIFTSDMDDDDPIELEWADSLLIPWEKLTTESQLYVSICGHIDGTQRAITKLMSTPFSVVQRGALEGVSAQDPTQDAYEQAYEDVLQATSTANEAETARAQAEAARVSAELDRIAAETARVSAEEQRVSSESARVEAESSRVQAEQQRATDSAEAIDDAHKAAWAAWDAASRAGWYIEDTTLYLGATAEIEGNKIVLGR